ncbi:MAG: hypothetical protein HOG49_16840 [Candidatus Scalindua sp.]|jgi:hypothetical protein|nr:hypothetical protein [Candidatus Scalindua sp.]
MAKQKEKIQIETQAKVQTKVQSKTQGEIQANNRFEERQPTMDRKITLSRDKKWLIIKTIRTDIVHVNYLDKVMGKGEQQ